jgi:hypothetical protein
MAHRCNRLNDILDVTPSALGCEECLKTGDVWVHLVCVVHADMLVAVTSPPIDTRQSTFTQPDTRLSRAMIHPKDGAGATSTK